MNIRKILTSFAVTLPLLAQEVNPDVLKKGYEVFRRTCSICHMEEASIWEFLRARLSVLKGERPQNIDAPPMNLISARIKSFYPNEVEFVEFVKDYITNPSREKGVCFKAAYVFFGIMPPIGQGMSEEEKTAVAEWMYYRYSDRWDDLFKKVKDLQKRVLKEK
ncbi:MAG: c-type cytochrome [Aquificota bacterium]|nr:c-type cytochrome [Aquificota bacterium]